MSHPRTSARRLLAVGAAVAIALLVAGVASAHEERDVDGYAFEVGLIGEPVFVGDKSGLEFFVHKDDKPVEGLETDAEGPGDLRGPDA